MPIKSIVPTSAFGESGEPMVWTKEDALREFSCLTDPSVPVSEEFLEKVLRLPEDIRLRIIDAFGPNDALTIDERTLFARTAELLKENPLFSPAFAENVWPYVDRDVDRDKVLSEAYRIKDPARQALFALGLAQIAKVGECFSIASAALPGAPEFPGCSQEQKDVILGVHGAFQSGFNDYFSLVFAAYANDRMFLPPSFLNALRMFAHQGALRSGAGYPSVTLASGEPATAQEWAVNILAKKLGGRLSITRSVPPGSVTFSYPTSNVAVFYPGDYSRASSYDIETLASELGFDDSTREFMLRTLADGRHAPTDVGATAGSCFLAAIAVGFRPHSKS